MSYILKKIHFDKCNYFDRDIFDSNYDVYSDPILPHIFDINIVLLVLESFVDNTYDFINKDNINEVLNIYIHLCCIEGDICKIFINDKFKNINYSDDISNDYISLIKEWNEILFQNGKLKCKLFEILLTKKQILFLNNDKFLNINKFHCFNIKDIKKITNEHNCIVFNYSHYDKYYDLDSDLNDDLDNDLDIDLNDDLDSDINDDLDND